MSEIYFNNLEFEALSVIQIKPGLNNLVQQSGTYMEAYFTTISSLVCAFHNKK